MMAGRLIIRLVVSLPAASPVVQAAAAAECGTPAAIGDGWQMATQESAGFDPKRLCELQAKLAAMPQHNVHGVVVVRGGRLVFENYPTGPDQRWGRDLGPTEHGPEVRHDVRSVSKSVTSLLVGIALDRKLIASVDEPVLALFPEYADLRTPEKDRILVRHLLAMSSGIAWDESLPYSDPRNSEIQMIRSPDPNRFVLEQPIRSAPDKVWNYSGGSTQLLGAIVEKVSGQRLDAFAREVLFEPLGIADVEWVNMPSGGVAVASGLRLRPRDMAKIGQLLLSGGAWDGRRIVSAEWLREFGAATALLVLRLPVVERPLGDRRAGGRADGSQGIWRSTHLRHSLAGPRGGDDGWDCTRRPASTMRARSPTAFSTTLSCRRSRA